MGEGLTIAVQAASALEHAHSREIIHRDVKPANIIVDKNDEVKLADFGVAKIQEGVDLTQSGEFLGSPMYMSPEQLLGRRLGPKTDIYSFGLVLYEMFSGEFPFDTKNFFERTVHEVIPPQEKCADLPDDLNDLVTACLRIDLEERLPDSSTLKKRCEMVLARVSRRGQTGRRSTPPIAPPPA